MRLLFLGDVVGRPGRRAVASVLPGLRRGGEIGVFVASGGNASKAKGINPRAAEELRDAGIDVLTSGNHIWQSRDIIPYLRENQRLLRPLNFAPDVPGVGWTVRPARRSGTPVAVVNLIGRTFMPPAGCPFWAVEHILPAVQQEARVILVDMHGEATSEKVAMGGFLAGTVSAVIRSPTHVQPADETVLSGGTAFLTDAGMCGPEHSVLGVRTDQVIARFRSQMPVRFDVASGPVLVQGAMIDVDETTGRATAIRRVRERVPA